MSEPNLRIRWNRFGDYDPPRNGLVLTVDKQGRLTELYSSSGRCFNFHGEVVDPPPIYWLEVVGPDIEPMFEFEWFDPDTVLPEDTAAGGPVVGFYYEDEGEPRLRVMEFSSDHGWFWRGEKKLVPDYWCKASATFLLPISRLEYTRRFAGKQRRATVSEPNLGIRWNRFGDYYPWREGMVLTVDKQGRLTELYLSCGEYFNFHGEVVDPPPTYWLEVVGPDIEPMFEFEWFDPDTVLPEDTAAGGPVVGFYYEDEGEPRLRVMEFSSDHGWFWRGEKQVLVPDYWCKASATFLLPISRLEYTRRCADKK